MARRRKLEMEGDGKDLFLRLDGKAIAKRGRPNTPQAGTWVSIVPGVVVHDAADLHAIAVEINGVRVH
jgi:hypothetical protein